MTAPTPFKIGDKELGLIWKVECGGPNGTFQISWPKFQSALQAVVGGVTNEDPFGGVNQPPQMAHLALAGCCSTKSSRLLPPQKARA